MQSPIARKKHPSKTFVIKKNTLLLQSADQGNKRQRSQRMSKSMRRRGNFLDKQEAFQINKFAAKLKHSSDSESDSDVSIGKSGKSESSESSIQSAKTIKSRSSKRIRGNLNQYTQDIFSTIIRKTESQQDQQKEEIQQKLFERMADKATAENYLLHQNLEQFDQPFKRSNQFQKDDQDSEHLFEIFSNLSNEDKQSDNSDASIQIQEDFDIQRIQQQKENSCHSPKMSIYTPIAEMSSTYFKPRVSNLRISLAGFSPLQVTDSSQSSEDGDYDQLQNLSNQFDKIYQKLTYVNGAQFIKYRKLESFRKYHLIYSSYIDNYKMLKFRKYVLYLYLIIKRISKIIVRSRLYQYILTLVTLGNIIIFVSEHLEQQDNKYQEINMTFLCCYVVDIVLQLFAFGVFRTKFIFLSRIIDATLIILYYYHLSYSQTIIDITPLRMTRLLKHLGAIFTGLQKMIEALIESLKFILESTAIVILFALFFASLGTSLFMGLLNERCLPSEESEWVQCREGQCSDGMTCQMTNKSYNIPTNFNNIIYSFGLILKTVTMDDWSWVMYYTIRAFHPIVWIYYVLIIFVGGFFGFNLPIAVFKTHFSEMQFREIQHIDERENVISKSNLNRIGFYHYIIQMNQFLFSNSQDILIIEPRTNRVQQSMDIEPRLLLGSMINENRVNVSNFTQLKNQIKNFSLKFLLLPKLSILQKYYINLDIKKFTQDPKIQDIIKQFSRSSFLLEKYVDYKYQYIQTSQLDILRNSLFQVLKTTDNKNSQTYKKKVFYYQPIQKKKSIIQRENIKSGKSESMGALLTNNQRSFVLLPIKISKRIKKNSQNPSEIHGAKSSSMSYSPNAGLIYNKEIEKQRRKYPYFMNGEQFIPKQTIYKPFTIYHCGELKLLLNGVYLDYEDISKRINAKIKFKQEDELKYQEEEYIKIKRKEFQKRFIKSRNWSGNNILINNWSLIKKFNDIFRQLNIRDIEIWQTSLSGILITLRKYAFRIIHFKLTKLIFDLTILINTLFLALQGIIQRSIIDQVEDIATILLSTEIILQLIVYKPRRIAKNKHLVIELLIVILSLIEFGFSDYLNVSEQYLRLMRSTKCLLFYRCISYIYMARIIGAIAQITYKSYVYLAFLMFFMILTFGLIGMELYAHKFDEYHKNGYMHSFDDPGQAFMTVFNIMTNDDWFGVYRIGTEVQTELSITYSIGLVFTLNYFIYGIMMAILLDGFSQYLERESTNEHNEFLKDKIKQINKLNKQLDSQPSENDSDSESESNSSSSSIQQYQDQVNNFQGYTNRFHNRKESISPDNIQSSSNNLREQLKRDSNFTEKIFHSLQFPVARTRKIDQQEEEKKKIKDDFRRLKSKTNMLKMKSSEPKTIKYLQENLEQIYRKMFKQNTKLYAGIDCMQSYYCFSKSNSLRKFFFRISSSNFIKYFIDLILLLSIIYLALPKNIQQTPLLVTILFILNSTIFIEFIIKSIAQGAFLDKGSYLNYTWKIVDLVYIIVYYMEFFEIVDLPIFIVIKTFIYFRPLKLLYRIKWVVRVRAALTQSLFDIINVFVVLLLVWLMFAVFSMMLYAGKMGFCEEYINYDVGQEECIKQGKEWKVYKHNFDNITTAMPVLFIISTFDGWGSILWVSQNSREAFNGPHPYFSQIPTYLFYVAFCTVGSMFFLQLFTGVLFINLKANSKLIENQQFTQAQLEYIKISEIILHDHPIRASLPKSQFRRILNILIMNKYMDLCIFSILLVNCIVIMMIHHSADDHYNGRINQIHHICTLIFATWLMLQFIILGINRFKDNFWRLYTSLVIILGVVDLILDFKFNWFKLYCNSTQLTQHYQLLRILYTLRNLRIIIIFQGLQNLQRLVRVMSFAFPFLLKILFILLIIMVVFAFYGVMLYGTIDKGEVINDLINFSNFWLAMLTLFKCVSGDDFRSIMNDCMHHNPYCSEDPKYCGSPYAQIYFISFMLISNYVLLNLFVLAMIEQFEFFFNNQDSILQTYVENIDSFRKTWFKFSTQNGQVLNIRCLPHLLIEIKEPLGCKPYDNLWDAAKLSLQFNLFCDIGDNISYNQLLYEIFYHRYQKQIFEQCSEMAAQKMSQFHKTMIFRLAYYRRKGLQQRRTNIGPQLKLDGNGNILHILLMSLIAFKVWKTYTHQIIANIITDQQYFSERTVRDTEPIKHSITLKSIESQESRIKLNDNPVYQKRRMGRMKRVSLQGQINDYLPGDCINPKPVLKRKSSLGIEEGNVQTIYHSRKIQKIQKLYRMN
ncbi:unnamed protein product [Paramecium pentaurelia]|uniref:Ion transport domain-containing protein n=1 Tax=Paramecium pentaurelia TaxID=43138 RepID=A0A8S1WNW1_9CILI|nr:unnamed protein product [Paramecium pentaurelia]